MFRRKRYGIACKTARGEVVRSIAEKRITDILFCHGVRYEYEPKLVSGWWVFKKVVSIPDFYLSDYNVYIEFWGLVNEKADYRKHMKWKMKQYHNNRIKVISIYPDNLWHLEWILKKKFEALTGIPFPKKEYYYTREVIKIPNANDTLL